MDRLERDVDAMRLKLAGVAEEATTVAFHYQDWWQLGIGPHTPPQVALARLDALEEALWAVVKTTLDARLAAGCVRAQVLARAAAEDGEDPCPG